MHKEEIKNRFRRSMESYDAHAQVQKQVARRLAAMVNERVAATPDRVLEIGCGTGLFTDELKRLYPTARLVVNDLVEELCERTAARVGIPPEERLGGDIEQVSFTGLFDLIASASTLQWMADPGTLFRKLSDVLMPGGLLIFSTYGKYNLREIRLTTGGGLNYRSQEEIMALLEPCFRVEEIAEEFRLMEFSDPFDILQHLKKTGVNVSGDPSIWTRGRVNAFIREYNRRFCLDGKVTLTFHPLYLVCRKREK